MAPGGNIQPAPAGPTAMAPGSNIPPGAQGTHMAQTPAKPAGPSPPFNMFALNIDLLKKSLVEILDGFYECSKIEALAQQEPGWPEAQGPSYRDVLGQPVSMPGPIGNMGGAPQPVMGAPPWQQPQQQPMGQAPPGAPVQGGNAPQMMPQQGFMVAQAPGAGGQNAQMFQPMYQGPGAPTMPAQRPQNAGNMQPPQDQQPMGFNQQNMIAQQPGPAQGMAVNMQVNPQTGQNPGGGFTMQPMQGGAMPKYGMQVMMVPTGQFPQNFVPQQGQQAGPPGGPGPGGPPGGPQPGHWQQAHMVPAHMMQQQVGPRGPPHPMAGHEG